MLYEIKKLNTYKMEKKRDKKRKNKINTKKSVAVIFLNFFEQILTFIVYML